MNGLKDTEKKLNLLRGQVPGKESDDVSFLDSMERQDADYNYARAQYTHLQSQLIGYQPRATLAVKGLSGEQNEAFGIFGSLKQAFRQKVDTHMTDEVVSNKWLIQPDHPVYAMWDLFMTIVLIFSIVETPV